MTTPPEIAKSGRSWLRYPTWVSTFARLNSRYRKAGIFTAVVLLSTPLLLRLVLQASFSIPLTLMASICIICLLLFAWPRLTTSRYENAAVFAAIMLLGVPLLFQLLLWVPFATTFTLMSFVCIMRLLLGAWPRDPETGRRRRRWLIPFPRTLGFMLFFGTWYTQPHFGANVCPKEGFMWNTDFVEQIRPMIHRGIRTHSVQQPDWLPDGVTVAQFTAVADQAANLLKQCVAERGPNYCRYAGSDPNGTMMDAYTSDGPNDIAPEDRDKYRYMKAGLDYDISLVQEDTGGSWFRIRTSRFGRPLETVGKICGLGCWCNVNYGG